MKFSAFDVLDVDEKACDEDIKQAYLKHIRDCPPERNPEKFEAIREAYEKIATEEKRLNYQLFEKPCMGLKELVEQVTRSEQACLPDASIIQDVLRRDSIGR